MKLFHSELLILTETDKQKTRADIFHMLYTSNCPITKFVSTSYFKLIIFSRLHNFYICFHKYKTRAVLSTVVAICIIPTLFAKIKYNDTAWNTISSYSTTNMSGLINIKVPLILLSILLVFIVNLQQVQTLQCYQCDGYCTEQNQVQCESTQICYSINHIGNNKKSLMEKKT